MHIYYYKKEDGIYVMDNNHKLYRYTNNNNIHMILELENMLTEYTKDLNEEPNEFRFKGLQETNIVEKDTLSKLLGIISTIQFHYFDDSAFPLLGMEGIIISLINSEYYNLKTYTQKEDIRYEKVLQNIIDEIQEKLQNLLEIQTYQKKEVPLSFLDEKANHIYLKRDSVKNFESEISFNIQANQFTKKTFNYEELNENEMDFLPRKEIENVKNLKIYIKQYQKEIPKEIQQKINYDNLFFTQRTLNRILHFSLFIPYLNELINRLSIETQLIINIFTCSVGLGTIFPLLKTNKKLETAENPVLTLNKEKRK